MAKRLNSFHICVTASEGEWTVPCHYRLGMLAGCEPVPGQARWYVVLGMKLEESFPFHI